MGFLSALTGGTLGVIMQFCANAGTKIPLSRKPWMHLSLFVGGLYVGDKYPKYEAQLLQEINESREERGLPKLMLSQSDWLGVKAASK
mmetsp:Transcript_7522/g.9824  ORF Transcript_7522/g.9824 Transcript_7522/m.9824 type:complete len:88 (+) Transcript_7522:152-415(+)